MWSFLSYRQRRTNLVKCTNEHFHRFDILYHNQLINGIKKERGTSFYILVLPQLIKAFHAQLT